LVYVISEVPGCDIWKKIPTRWADMDLGLGRVVETIDGELRVIRV
jgi:hypothetical protein